MTDVAGAIEGDGKLAVLVVLPADSVGCSDEVAVGRGCRGLLDFPEPVGKSGLRGVRIEDDLRTVQAELAPAFRKVAVIADVDPYRADSSLEHRVSEGAWANAHVLA